MDFATFSPLSSTYVMATIGVPSYPAGRGANRCGRDCAGLEWLRRSRVGTLGRGRHSRSAPDAQHGIEEEGRAPPEGVDEDGGDAGRHRCYRPDRVHEPRGRRRDAETVEEKRQGHILLCLAVAPPADLPRGDNRT